MTPADSPIVESVAKAVREVIGVEPKKGGVGGGTFGAIARRAGFDAVVWSQIYSNPHTVNEKANIDHMLNNTKVLYAVLAGIV